MAAVKLSVPRKAREAAIKRAVLGSKGRMALTARQRESLASVTRKSAGDRGKVSATWTIVTSPSQ